MDEHKKFDFIIAGAGAAGLSLLWHLLHSPLKEKRILLIDASFAVADDKTWCFWDEDHPFMQDLYHHWEKLEVVSGGQIFSQALENYRYCCIRSRDYREKILAKANSLENILILESPVVDFYEEADTGYVLTGMGKFSAGWIFQSVLKPSSSGQVTVDTALLQHFKGWEIEADRPLFDPKKATLMDLDIAQKNGLTFFYTLPFTDCRALIEFTVFSANRLEDSDYDKAIGHYLASKYRLSNGDYKILRQESGVIPMEDRRVPGYINSRTLNIGTVGGVTKPTTGYTFTRAHRHSLRITSALLRDSAPPPWPGSSYRFRVYDIMLLYLLANDAKSSRAVFHCLFAKNSMDRVLQFLNEETRFMQELAIFSKMHYAPFFKSIYKMKHRLLSGA